MGGQSADKAGSKQAAVALRGGSPGSSIGDSGCGTDDRNRGGQLSEAEKDSGQTLCDSDSRGGILGNAPGNLGMAEPQLAMTSLLPTASAREIAPAARAPFVAPPRVAATCGTTEKPLESTSATCGKWQVDYVRASENTYAFRLRWAVGKKRGTPVYVSRVSATIFEIIRKRNYEAFKKQLIAIHGTRALSAGKTID